MHYGSWAQLINTWDLHCKRTGMIFLLHTLLRLACERSERGLNKVSTVWQYINDPLTNNCISLEVEMVFLRTTLLALAGIIVVSNAAQSALSNIKNVVVLVQENRYAEICIFQI